DKDRNQLEKDDVAVSHSKTKCSNCQEDIDVNVKYCPYCGFDQATDLSHADETSVEVEMTLTENGVSSEQGLDISQSEYEEVEVEKVEITPHSPINDTAQNNYQSEEKATYSDAVSSNSIDVAPLWVNNLPPEIQDIISRGKQFRGKTTIRTEIFEKYKNPQSEEIARKTSAISDEEENALYAAEQEFIEKKRRIAQEYEQKRQFETQKIKENYSERINKEIEATLELERSKAKKFAQDMGEALNQLIENT
ncbi:MAG TPA: zinc ribbon domain-containing protein, partial [Lactococcus sp.]|nr:zinc ribbon domain-containing protein [Lactococcus sp.]